jgi:two-component system C4-dicarboxylate transport sensor histidine kinase DctB
LTLLEYRLEDEQVEVALDLPPQPVYVTGNAVRLEQVMVNLLSNALDAMSDRPRRLLSVRLRCAAGTAVLTVADTGRGIARENLGLVFDPFYTTKEVGQGLGLGLSISYGIIRDMGGEITVDSVPDAGTTFRVALPLAAPEASTAASPDVVT